mmetsp:Transcript_76314/g.154765  ORF Transcript_76314/g.154765 Transcript_76314/m.154765 type:complete len:335 (+) Transcript_76314:2325-3329(+)
MATGFRHRNVDPPDQDHLCLCLCAGIVQKRPDVFLRQAMFDLQVMKPRLPYHERKEQLQALSQDLQKQFRLRVRPNLLQPGKFLLLHHAFLLELGSSCQRFFQNALLLLVLHFHLSDLVGQHRGLSVHLTTLLLSPNQALLCHIEAPAEERRDHVFASRGQDRLRHLLHASLAFPVAEDPKIEEPLLQDESFLSLQPHDEVQHTLPSPQVEVDHTLHLCHMLLHSLECRLLPSDHCEPWLQLTQINTAGSPWAQDLGQLLLLRTRQTFGGLRAVDGTLHVFQDVGSDLANGNRQRVHHFSQQIHHHSCDGCVWQLHTGSQTFDFAEACLACQQS